MARWRAAAGRIEAPEWYRNYHPEDWDEPDEHELRMRAGCPSMDPWPDDLRVVHAKRRWEQARHEYRQAHPAFATQELEDLFEEFWRTLYTPWGYRTIVVRRAGRGRPPRPGARWGRRTRD